MAAQSNLRGEPPATDPLRRLLQVHHDQSLDDRDSSHPGSCDAEGAFHPSRGRSRPRASRATGANAAYRAVNGFSYSSVLPRELLSKVLTHGDGGARILPLEGGSGQIAGQGLGIVGDAGHRRIRTPHAAPLPYSIRGGRRRGEAMPRPPSSIPLPAFAEAACDASQEYIAMC